MLTLPRQTWVKYVNRLSAIDKAAGDKMRQLFEMGGFPQDYKASKQILDYANSLVMVYGEASAALAAEMYDAISALENVTVPPAVPAEVPSYGEVAKAVNGTMKSGNIEIVAGAIERLVKLPSADTMLQNAKRDGAEWAWIPNGDTCMFCLTLASRGWQPASKAILDGGHAEHIHAHCDCNFMIRHDSSTTVQGYDHEKYLEMYKEAPGNSSKDKINAMRREAYAENKEIINAQKRSAYAKRKELNSSKAEELRVN
jgi:hypothetical protein